MNKERRRRLAKAAPIIAEALARLAEARAIVAEVRDDEREVYEGMSDGQQASDMGDEMQTAIAAMEEALDAIDAIDLKEAARSLDETANAIDTMLPAKETIDAEELQHRRMARLPDWARQHLERAEKATKKAQDELAAAFSEPKGEATEIVVGDYGSPMHGKVVPARMVSFPAFGITVSVERGRGGRGVVIQGERSLIVLPNVSNSITVRPD